MHFWNKLSTAALMRLSILAALNLVLARVVGSWDILLHPWFFLSIVTINLGLYAIMVYSGTLNTTLIGMMVGGLAATLGTLAYAGMDAIAFMYGGPFQYLGRLLEWLLNLFLQALPASVSPGRPVQLDHALLGYLVVDALGVVVILAGGALARHLQSRMQRGAGPTVRPSP
jgi:hypothetical protein